MLFVVLFSLGFLSCFGTMLCVSWFFLHGYFVTALVFCNDSLRDKEHELPKSVAVPSAGNGSVLLIRSF